MLVDGESPLVKNVRIGDRISPIERLPGILDNLSLMKNNTLSKFAFLKNPLLWPSRFILVLCVFFSYELPKSCWPLRINLHSRSVNEASPNGDSRMESKDASIDAKTRQRAGHDGK